MKGRPMAKSASSTISSGVDDRRRAELLLLAPDDEVIGEIMAALRDEHVIRGVPDIAALRSALAVRGADLLILDHMALIKEDMAHICRSIRLTSSVAIIVLVSSDDPDYRIRMLEAGADECFSRLLGTREIKARVTGLLRRAAFGAGVLSMGGILRFAGWSIDPHRRLLMDPDGRNIDLTAAEFDLLWAFCRNSGKTLSRRTLLTFTRVGAARPVERSIDVHVNRLRRKIEHDPHRPIFLRTVRLGGYVFTPRVEADLGTDGKSVRTM
jgi:two-component system, OmpR family, response regulator